MNPLLRDLYGHQAWADAEHWRAVAAHPSAREDAAIRFRLHHLHEVQRSFMWMVGDRAQAFRPSAVEDFASFADLAAFAMTTHDLVSRTLAQLDEARLGESVTIAAFDPPLAISVTEVLTQCAMHSQWHRGQNATRLRELGAEPPFVDLIVWYACGRPTPVWT